MALKTHEKNTAFERVNHLNDEIKQQGKSGIRNRRIKEQLLKLEPDRYGIFGPMS